MGEHQRSQVAIVYPGDYETRKNATPQNNRLASVFSALSDLGIRAEPAVYQDEFADDVLKQLLDVQVVLVWMNPIQDGRDRSILDPMLRNITQKGIFVSTHPDVILKMGTKEVLYRTRTIGWGCDTHLYRSLDQLRKELPERLAPGKARVLKQYRGNGGLGVWKIEVMKPGSVPEPGTRVRVRHARKGSVEETISLEEFFTRCAPYFSKEGRLIDQAYQERLPEGMIRCYMVHDKVVGFGHQAINALYPAPPGTPSSQAPQPGPRLYHPPDRPDFQDLKNIVEQKWVSKMQRALDISTERLPVLWDCDFLFGPKKASGEDTYVLCEINASSIAPYPESAPPFIAQAVKARLNLELPASPS